MPVPRAAPPLSGRNGLSGRVATGTPSSYQRAAMTNKVLDRMDLCHLGFWLGLGLHIPGRRSPAAAYGRHDPERPTRRPWLELPHPGSSVDDPQLAGIAFAQTWPVSALLGRDQELARAQAFLEAARERFSLHLLEGEAGIGKTAVFDEIIRRAQSDGALVLQCRAAQAEAKLTLAAVADLLEHVPTTAIESLPGPQRRAIEVALLLTDPGDEPVTDRVLGTAVRSVLVHAAATRPVLVAIDDLHWLDAASAAVLGYVLRRLADEPIGVLVVQRLGEPVRLRLDEVVRAGAATRDVIGPLKIAAIHHLIRQRLGESLSRPTLVRVYEASAGNPLFALEIARLLGEVGAVSAGQPLPIPRDVESLVRKRVAGLPGRTRDVLRAAAALGNPRAELIGAAVGRAIDADLEPAVRRGIASLVDGLVRFGHPLFGAVVYASMQAPEQRRLHARLAEVVDDLEERARHLALAVHGQDEATAAIVHAAAREASFRGAPAAAIELLELALAVGKPDPETEATRIYDLADNLAFVGDNIRARAILDRVDPARGWPTSLHGPALELAVELEYWTSGAGIEVERLGERLLGGELSTEVRALVHASLARHLEHDLPRALEHADASLALLRSLGDDADPRVESAALAFRVRNRLVLGDGFDRREMRRALELEGRVRRAPRRLERASDGFGQWLKYADEIDEARRLLESGLQRELEMGYEKGVLNKFQHLALTECLAGNLELAHEHALRACELHDQERSNILGYAYAILAIVQAHLGDADGVSAVEEMYRRQDAPPHLLVATGLLALSLGRNQVAFDHYARALEACETAGLLEPGIHRIHANAAEAAVALGDLRRAAELATYLEEHGARTGHRWSLATGARSRALVLAATGDVSASLAACELAMSWHEDLPMPFERARTLLIKGVVERRARLRTRAKESLGAAHELFDRMGARIWADRARQELDRIGLRRSPGAELTEGERRCAELAASGMTNREVAAALFISPKTVEANLARAYRKLGVGSRAELGARMRETLQT
jgi:DNA-binding CsgD family transcriptional regulator